jgi:hypothetical protein
MSEKPPKLPDHALTAYCATGTRGLIELVAVGLLDHGTYECPECEGVAQSSVALMGLMRAVRCEWCMGCGAVAVGDGFVCVAPPA